MVPRASFGATTGRGRLEVGLLPIWGKSVGPARHLILVDGGCRDSLSHGGSTPPCGHPLLYHTQSSAGCRPRTKPDKRAEGRCQRSARRGPLDDLRGTDLWRGRQKGLAFSQCVASLSVHRGTSS